MNPHPSGTVVIQSCAFHLSGENTKRWCNGMFSNNFRSMQPNQAHRSVICDDRGRIQGLLDSICVDPENFIIYLEGRSEEWFTQRFQMYMMLDDIEMDVFNNRIIHIFGQDITHLSAAGFPIPELGEAILHNGIWVIRRSRLNGSDGCDLLLSEDAQTSFSDVLEQVSTESITEDVWEQIRIGTGTPKFPIDFTEKSFIHEYNLEEFVCSFNKGCYVGQEIINRMDIKQLVNKKLLRLQLNDGSWQVGDSLTLSSKNVATITSIGISSNGSRIGLGIIKKKAWAVGTALQGEHGEAVVIG